MELWLLGAGAIVLIGITLWIVWPARTADAVGNSSRGEEVLDKPMDENARPTMPPIGERFRDQYTSATADLSAGGAAGAVETRPGDAPGETPVTTPGWSVTPPATSQRWPALASSGPGLAQSKTIGLGAASLLMVGGGIGGAWLYARWQRERNKPINRLRRGAREVTSRLGERMPDVDELPPVAAPSGAAAALLLTGLLASRALRHDDDRTEQVRDAAGDVLHEAMGRGRDAAKRGRKALERSASPPPPQVARRPRLMGLGLGGIAIVAGGSYLVWRLVRGGPAEPKPWYAGG
jgi:hypothetical protein